MNQDRYFSRLARDDIEVVVVVAGNRQVPHPPVVDGRDRAFHHDRHLAVGCLEMHARFEVFCRNPAVVRIRVPEQAADGGVDDLGAPARAEVGALRVLSRKV
jgi:hypothetical protein